MYCQQIKYIGINTYSYIRKKKYTTSAGERVEEREPSCVAGRNVN